jgi:hypothetical protein
MFFTRAGVYWYFGEIRLSCSDRFGEFIFDCLETSEFMLRNIVFHRTRHHSTFGKPFGRDGLNSSCLGTELLEFLYFVLAEFSIVYFILAEFSIAEPYK